MGKEEVKFKIPWIPLIAYTIVMAVIIRFLSFFVGPNTYSWVLDHIIGVQYDGGWVQGGFLPQIILWLAVLATPALAKKFNNQLLTLLYAATVMCAVTCGYVGIYNVMTVYMSCRTASPERSQYIPNWWMPPKDDALPALLGGASVPWGSWIPTFVTWIFVPIICYFMFTSLMIIVRRQWIEVEDLPYPHARMAYEIQSYVVNFEDPETKAKIKVALIGFVVMFLFALPYIIIPLFPQFPDPYGFTKWHRFHFGWYDTKKFARWLYDSVHGLRRLFLHPIYIVIGYFAPLTTLNTVVFAFLFRLFVPNILVTMGYPSAWHGHDIMRRWPFNFAALVHGGMLPGMLLFWLFVNRRYIINTLRAAFGKAPPEFKEMEKEEPMSYRMAYITFIVTFLLMIAFVMPLVTRLDIALVVVGGALLVDGFIRMRLYAYTGIYNGFCSWEREGTIFWGPFYLDPSTNNYYPNYPTRYLPDAGWAVWGGTLCDRGFAGSYANNQGWVQGWGAFMGDIFRMAYLTKTPIKAVFQVSTVAMILSTFISVPMIIWAWYTWGVKALPARMEGCQLHLVLSRDWPASMGPINPALGGFWIGVPWMVAGYILGILISFAQTRFVWFPFDVFGFYISWNTPGAKYGIDFLFTIAWILKVLTIKLGGTRAYERYGVPFAAGAMAGWVVHILIHELACTYRFFAPGA